MSIKGALKALVEPEPLTTLGSIQPKGELKSLTWQNAGALSIDGALSNYGNSYADRAKYATDLGDVLRVSPVMAAVKWLSRNIHQGKLSVTRRATDGDLLGKTYRHPALKLLRRPNKYYTGRTLMKSLGTSWMCAGNAFILKKRNFATLKVEELWWEPHYTIRARWPGDKIYAPWPNQPDPRDTAFISFYEIYRRGKWYKVDVDNVIHFRDGIDPSATRYGINGISALLAELYTDQQRATFSATVLENIGMIPYVVSPRDSGSFISETKARELKNSLITQARQSRGQPIIAGRAIRIDELGFSPADMDLAALAAIPEERVASVMGPNAYVLGFVTDRNTFSTYSEAREDAYESYLMPLLDYFAEQLTDDLLAEFGAVETVSEMLALEYDFSEVLALQDLRDKLFLRYGRAFRDGITTRYTALRATGQPADKERDDYYVQDIPKALPDRAPEDQGADEGYGSNNPGYQPASLPGARHTDGNGNDRAFPGNHQGPGKGKGYGPAK